MFSVVLICFVVMFILKLRDKRFLELLLLAHKELGVSVLGMRVEGDSGVISWLWSVGGP